MPYEVLKSIQYRPAFAPQLLHGDDRARVVLACLDVGQQIPPHQEDKQGYFYVLEGSGTFLTDEGPVPVAAGELVTAPAGSTRGLRADRERLSVLVVAVLPPAG